MIDFSKYPTPNTDLALTLYDVLHELRMPEYESKKGSVPAHFFAAMHKNVLAPDYVMESHYHPWHYKMEKLLFEEVWGLTEKDRKIFLMHDVDLSNTGPNMEGKFEYMQTKAPFASLFYEYNFLSYKRTRDNLRSEKPEFAIESGDPLYSAYSKLVEKMRIPFSTDSNDYWFKSEDNEEFDVLDMHVILHSGSRELCRLLSVGFILQDPTEDHIQQYKEGLHFHFGYIKKLKTLDRKIAREWATL